MYFKITRKLAKKNQKITYNDDAIHFSLLSLTTNSLVFKGRQSFRSKLVGGVNDNYSNGNRTLFIYREESECRLNKKNMSPSNRTDDLFNQLLLLCDGIRALAKHDATLSASR